MDFSVANTNQLNCQKVRIMVCVWFFCLDSKNYPRISAQYQLQNMLIVYEYVRRIVVRSVICLYCWLGSPHLYLYIYHLYRYS